MRLFWPAVLLCVLLVISGCASTQAESPSPSPTAEPKRMQPATPTPTPTPEPVLNTEGGTIAERFAPPSGYIRPEVQEDSFAEYLRALPLRPHDTKVMRFDGTTKPEEVWAAVVDLDIGTKDAQQNTRTLIRLRAEYLYAAQQWDKLAFRFMSGFLFDFATWKEGGRVSVSGSNVSWKQSGTASDDYESFLSYLQTLYVYANATSLALDTVPVTDDIQPGDIYISGASGVMVVDLARNPQTDETVCLLAQGRKPAEDTHILLNQGDEMLSPWYKVTPDGALVTPEVTFAGDTRRRFAE